MTMTSTLRHGRVAGMVSAALIAATALLAGCGGSKEKGATQVAAKVNKEEISVHQINFVLQQQRNLRPEQVDAVSRQVLDRLIDQELAVQKAQELKIEREPRVLQQIEAARREIIARAYVEKLGEAVTKPSADEIKKYYEDKPALFKERRIYNILELAIETTPDQLDGLRAQLQGAKSINEFVDYLKSKNIRFTPNQAVRPAEQVPLTLLDTFAKMKDGQTMLVPAANGAQVIALSGSRSEPVDEVRARPAIEQYLLNEARRKQIDADMKAMRAAAKIEYMGKFAEPAASSPATVPMPEPTAVRVAPGASAAKGLSTEDISKGMGIK